MTNSNLLLKISSMTIGATGLALSSYNIVKDGNIKAKRDTKDELGADYLEMHVQNLSSSRESHLLEKAKNFLLEKKFNNSYYSNFIMAKNHVVNWVGEIVENIVPITLSIVALTAPTLVEKYKTNQIMPMINNSLESVDKFYGKIGERLKNSNVSGKIFDFAKKMPEKIKAQKAETIIAAAAAGILVLGAGKILIHDVMGIGKSKEY